MNIEEGKVYIINRETGEISMLCGDIKDVEIKSPSEEMMELQKELTGSISLQIDEESPFIKEIQNQHKKYLRDKAQYKFWKDKEFAGNNRAGRRRKK